MKGQSRTKLKRIVSSPFGVSVFSSTLIIVFFVLPYLLCPYSSLPIGPKAARNSSALK